MKTVEETRRELFEAWANKDHIDHDGVCYENPYVESAWNGFNAALDAVEIELPDRPGDYCEQGWAACEMLDGCRDAIESTNLGIKVK